MALVWNDSGTTDTRVMRKLRGKKERKIALKEIILKEKAEKIIGDLKAKLGMRLADLTEVDEIIYQVLAEHFDIAENWLVYYAKKTNWKKLPPRGLVPSF